MRVEFLSSFLPQAGRFSFIQLIIYIGSTLSYYALVRDSRSAPVRFVLSTETLTTTVCHYMVI